MQMETFKTIIFKVVAECPVNLEGILFVHFTGSFEPTLSGSMAKEFKFGLIRAKNLSTVDESFVFGDVLEVIVLLYSLI